MSHTLCHILASLTPSSALNSPGPAHRANVSPTFFACSSGTLPAGLKPAHPVRWVKARRNHGLQRPNVCTRTNPHAWQRSAARVNEPPQMSISWNLDAIRQYDNAHTQAMCQPCAGTTVRSLMGVRAFAEYKQRTRWVLSSGMALARIRYRNTNDTRNELNGNFGQSVILSA